MTTREQVYEVHKQGSQDTATTLAHPHQRLRQGSGQPGEGETAAAPNTRPTEWSYAGVLARPEYNNLVWLVCRECSLLHLLLILFPRPPPFSFSFFFS